jgi:hypothetical protein
MIYLGAATARSPQAIGAAIALIQERFGYLAIGLGEAGIRHRLSEAGGADQERFDPIKESGSGRSLECGSAKRNPPHLISAVCMAWYQTEIASPISRFRGSVRESKNLCAAQARHVLAAPTKEMSPCLQPSTSPTKFGVGRFKQLLDGSSRAARRFIGGLIFFSWCH